MRTKTATKDSRGRRIGLRRPIGPIGLIGATIGLTALFAGSAAWGQVAPRLPTKGGGYTPPVKPGGRAIDAPQFKYFLAMLTSKKPALSPEVSAGKVRSALETMFEGLSADLRKAIEPSPPVFCFRNGCVKEVHYPDEATFKAIDEALFPGYRVSPAERPDPVCPSPTQIKPPESQTDCLARRKRLEDAANAMYQLKPYPFMRSGRLPSPGGKGFVALWVFQFPLKPIVGECGPAGCFR